MKKYFLSAIITGSAVFSCLSLFAQENAAPRRFCPEVEHMKRQESLDPALKAKRMQMESVMRNYIQAQKAKPNPSPQAVVTIPVVVHILWNASRSYQNVSDAVVNNTIASFNKDLSKTNADFASMCPGPFQSKAADCQIQFCLAKQDPSGALTTGIIRKQTSYQQFPVFDASLNFLEYMKFTSKGGDDVWDHNRYLNFWICDMNDSRAQIYGYGQFPDQDTINPSPKLAATDGIVIQYNTLPGAPNGNPTLNRGRTSVHEFGHFLYLYHIWGDDSNVDGICGVGETYPAECNGSDFVADTPKQCDCHLGKPTFPQKDACANDPASSNLDGAGDPVNGTMYMNYMDYTDDDHMVMFTTGQRDRMQAAMYYFRRGLLTSNGCSAPSGTGNNEMSLDHFVDVYPNPSTGSVFIYSSIPNVASADVMIYNTVGEIVLTKKMTLPQGNDVELNMTNIPDGMYFVKLKTSEGTITKKVVINR